MKRRNKKQGARLKGASFSGMRANFQWLNVSPMRLKGIYAYRQPW
jgi:hypothetical protein